MNRIYQGRVSRVEFLDGKDADGKPKWSPLPDWEFVLWRHHEIFQDAVNYYLVALCALADPSHSENRLFKDLRLRLAEAWEVFPKAGCQAPRSLRQSLQTWLDLHEKDTIQTAYEKVMEGNDSPPNARALALALLLDKCGGETRIKTGGRDYFPRFCAQGSKPTYDFDAASQAAGEGKSLLSRVLHGDSSQAQLEETAAKLDLSWTVKINPGAFFTVEESNARLKEAIAHIRNLIDQSKFPRVAAVVAQFPNAPDQLDEFSKSLDSAPIKDAVPRNRKASKDLTFATLVFKFFPRPLTAKMLSLFVAKPGVKKAGSKRNGDFAVLGGDPIRIARGKREFVFPAFTALPPWNPASPGEPVWKEFDLAAFKEALKSLNQFSTKTQEREKNQENLRGQIAFMLGRPIKGWKPSASAETGEEEPLPEPLDLKLLELARELERDLTTELTETVPDAEETTLSFGEAAYTFRPGGWEISEASLRGYGQILDLWRAAHKKYGDDLTMAHLVSKVKEYQADEQSKRAIGSIPLFLKLCEQKYWNLWIGHEDAIDEDDTMPFLRRMVLLHSKIAEFCRAQEPINLTPAEPKYSRRLYGLSDVQDKTAKVVHGSTETGAFVECAIVDASSEPLKEQRMRLFYSGRRLLRDELQGGVESRWLQPMTKALGIEVEEAKRQKGFAAAVNLMPERKDTGEGDAPCAFLLNFPLDLDPSWIHNRIGKAARWQKQFNGIKDKHLHLHWPNTVKAGKNPNPWWKNPTIIERGFACLSVDLGQRNAGAWAFLHVSCTDPRTGQNPTRRPVRRIGSDGEHTWFAEVMSTGMLRLPGEDQRALSANGTWKIEPSGSAGRNAEEEEWNEARALASRFLAEKPEAWVGYSHLEKSFPEQNDALIALANRRLTRLNTYHRWSCFDPDRAEISDRRNDLIERLKEELSHWENPKVQTWKSLVDHGDFAGFRAAAGHEFSELRSQLEGDLLALANLAVPLRDRSWRWMKSQDGLKSGIYGQLVNDGLKLQGKPTKIRGQRGLSLSRIEQLENLRRLFLRYNRSFDREPGKVARFGRSDFGRRSGEPCTRLLEKIEQLKEQRVNQTAHLILAEALGVRLRPHVIDGEQRQQRDIHGEYEKTPGREPVDFIVIENLDRYLTSQGRGPSENSRLMKWSHRAVRDKIKMLAEEPFGIHVLEASAGCSSRFCAATALPGARCEERPSLDPFLRKTLQNRAERAAKPGQPPSEVWAKLLNQFDELERLNQQRLADRPGKPLFTLFLPKKGGPLFMPIAPVVEGGRPIPRQADINAAINIGLRAVASPEAFDILHRIRTEADKGSFAPVKKNAREKAVFGAAHAKVLLEANASQKLAAAGKPNFFYDGGDVAQFDRATLTCEKAKVPVSSQVGIWTAVNLSFPSQIVELNEQRLQRWREKLRACKDYIPM